MPLDSEPRILLVEDARAMRRMETRILAEAGFPRVIQAVDGRDAADRLMGGEKIDLVISDWSMPNMDGLQLVQWLRGREEFKKLPVLMATSHGDKTYVREIMAAGANGVLSKPFTAEELKAAMTRVLNPEAAPAPGAEASQAPRLTPGLTDDGRPRLRMAHIQITDHLALGMLKERIDSGLETPAHFALETRCLGSWNPLQAQLEEGEVDGALILAPMAMDMFSYHTPIRLVLFAHRNGSICVRKRRNGRNGSEASFFRDRSFYIPHKMSIHNLLAHEYFKRLGLKAGVANEPGINVLLEVAPPVAMPEILRDNAEAAGFLVAEPIGSLAIAAGIAEPQFLSSQLWDHHPCCVVVFRDEIIRQHPEAVGEFTQMMVRAGRAIPADIAGAARVAVNFLDPQGQLGLQPELLAGVLADPAGIVYDDLYPAREELAIIQDYMNREMGVGRPADLNAFVDTSFADQACRNAPDRIRVGPRFAVASAASPGARINSAVSEGSAGNGGGRFMAKNEKTREGLEEEEWSEDDEDTQKDKYLTFHLNQEDYGIEIRFVTEIIGIQNITRVPDMPPFLKGVINLRGKVIPVMDVRTRFGMPEQEYDERTCIIVVNIENTAIGLVVDKVQEVVDIPESQVEPAPEMSRGKSSPFLQGMGKIDDEVKILLNVEQLLYEDELNTVKAASGK